MTAYMIVERTSRGLTPCRLSCGEQLKKRAIFSSKEQAQKTLDRLIYFNQKMKKGEDLDIIKFEFPEDFCLSSLNLEFVPKDWR
jgi:hypothetical protein